MSVPEIPKNLELDGARPSVEDFLSRYFGYLPLFFIFIAAGLLIAQIHLRYTHSTYVVRSRVVINLPDEAEKRETGIKISLANESNATVDKETEVLKSQENLYQVIINLGLFAEVQKQGRVLISPLFGNVPFSVVLSDPSLIKVESTFPVSIDQSRNRINVAGIWYNASEQAQTPFGSARFYLNPTYTPKAGENLFLHVVPPVRLARELSARISIIPKTKESEITDIGLKDEVPERAVAIINGMIRVYDSLTVKRQKDKSLAVIGFIDRRIGIIAGELHGVEKELEAYKSGQDIVDLKTEGSAFFEKIQESEKLLGVVDLQLKVLDQVEASLAQRTKAKSTLPSIVELTNTNLTNLLLQLYQTETELDKQQKLSGPENPQVVYLREHADKMRPAIIESIHNLRKNYLLSRQNYQRLTDHYEGLLKGVPKKERRVLDITRRQEVKNAIYTFLLQKREESALTAAAVTPRTQILEKPENVGLLSPVPSTTYVLYGLLGSLLALIVTWTSELFNNTVKSKTELERLVKVPIVADVNFINMEDNRTEVVIGATTQTIVAEQFRNLRTNLTYMGLSPDHKVLLVTSSLGREGKSFVALNTAIALSLAGRKVLLMDFDLRKPKLSRTFAEKVSFGISNFLIGERTFDEIIRPFADFNSLFLASAGTIPPNPTELILAERMIELIALAKEKFEFIVLDTPPLGAVTDAKLLGAHADVSLFVVRQNFTPRFFINMIAEFSSSNVFNKMGLVFNGIKIRHMIGDNRYRYGYGYGYHAGEPQGSRQLQKNPLSFTLRKKEPIIIK